MRTWIPCAPALALVDQAVAALILPSNNIELAGGAPEPRAGAAGTANGRRTRAGLSEERERGEKKRRKGGDDEGLDVGPRDVLRSTGLGPTQRAILAVAPDRLQRWS